MEPSLAYLDAQRGQRDVSFTRDWKRSGYDIWYMIYDIWYMIYNMIFPWWFTKFYQILPCWFISVQPFALKPWLIHDPTSPSCTAGAKCNAPKELQADRSEGDNFES
jgi:hypothetical protein